MSNYPPSSPAPPLVQSGFCLLILLWIRLLSKLCALNYWTLMISEIHLCWFCSVYPRGLSLLSLLLFMVGCMDAQGVLVQNRTIPPIQTVCYCQSSLTIVILFLLWITILIVNFIHWYTLFRRKNYLSVILFSILSLQSSIKIFQI